MIFFYTRYEYVLAQKSISGTLKKQNQTKEFDLFIITPATKFLGFPIGGGLVKMSRLYTKEGQLIHAREYSEEIKQEVKNLKSTCKIPYFKLWKGYLMMMVITLVAAFIFGINNKIKANNYNKQTSHLTECLDNLKIGQLYGASFFTDAEGNSINGLPQGWIKIEKIDGDTIFVKRTKELVEGKALFNLEDIEMIKPKSEQDFSDKIEPLFISKNKIYFVLSSLKKESKK